MSAPSADMICGRPSVRLPSVSGVDSQLDVTVVRPSLQSASEPPALDLQTAAVPPVSEYEARLLWMFLTSFSTKNLHSTYSFTRALRTLCHFYAFLELRARAG